jgi:hypothetical protein
MLRILTIFGSALPHISVFFETSKPGLSTENRHARNRMRTGRRLHGRRQGCPWRVVNRANTAMQPLSPGVGRVVPRAYRLTAGLSRRHRRHAAEITGFDCRYGEALRPWIVFDAAQDWRADSLSLLQAGGTPVALSALPRLLSEKGLNGSKGPAGQPPSAMS